VSLEALKRRFEDEAGAAALPHTAPAPPTSADKGAAGGAAAAEEPADSFAVNVEHDSETGGDDMPTRSATLSLSSPLRHGPRMRTLLLWLLTGRPMLGLRPWPPSSAASRHPSPTRLQ
jgi:hypothetical protein